MPTLELSKPLKQSSGMITEIINGFTFYYNPLEITITQAIRDFLHGFRTEDGETSFVLTMDEEGLVVY